MKLRIGDKVKFLNEVGEGIVTRVKDNKTVFVEMPDGFEIPFPVNQLVPIHTELIINSGAGNIEMDDEDAQLNEAVYFVVEPDHEYQPLVSDYKMYLFNASSFNLMFTYSIKDDTYFQTIKHGEIGAYQKVLLKQVKLPFFKEYNYHKLECILYKNTFYRAQLPISEIVYLAGDTLANTKAIKHQEFKLPVFAFVLKDEFIQRQNVETELRPEDVERLKTIKEFKPNERTSKSAKEYLKSLEKEVDLHIEELVENVSGLSNFDMLKIQRERFEKELDKAMTGNIRKIIFIHGVGNGRLKQEIISILKTTKGINYHDASHKEYGFGATQVNIL